MPRGSAAQCHASALALGEIEEESAYQGLRVVQAQWDTQDILEMRVDQEREVTLV